MKVVTVRLPEKDLAQLEEIRRTLPGASQSDLIREAIREWVRARRREQIRSELRTYAADTENLRRMADLAEWLGPLSEEALRHAEAPERGEIPDRR